MKNIINIQNIFKIIVIILKIIYNTPKNEKYNKYS